MLLGIGLNGRETVKAGLFEQETLPTKTTREETMGVKMECQEKPFGTTADGTLIREFTLSNGRGIVVRLINFGATVVSVEAPDRRGKSANLVLGHSALSHWLQNPCYFGSTVGRYGNRIANGRFVLNGNVYSLARNDGDHHLHGGRGGFHKALWESAVDTTDTEVSVAFSRLSPDGEDGYPGHLQTTVRYILTSASELRIEYEATTDKPTVVNLTNHCYWNLTGQPREHSILNHLLTLHCDRFLPVSETLIPTGDMVAVANTAMDFTTPHTIGERISEVAGGYDHCYVVNRAENSPALVARVEDPMFGRVMEILTTEPGIQFYSGNFLNGRDENGGFGQHHGFCLETQHFPDSPNQSHFPTTVLKPGDRYSSTTIHRFGVTE